MKIETELRYTGFELNDIVARACELAQPKLIRFRRAVFDIPSRQGWLRLRTDGSTTTLTVKSAPVGRPSESLESEVVVHGFDEALGVLNAIGIYARSVQTNYRILFLIQGCELTVDLWPRIAPLVEIEGEDEGKIQQVADLFPDLARFRTEKTISELYDEVGIDVKNAKNLDFEVPPEIVVRLGLC